jgi:hypothetical protein
MHLCAALAHVAASAGEPQGIEAIKMAVTNPCCNCIIFTPKLV